MELRSYQREVIEIIESLESGSYLVQMATGLGKTVTFANIKRKGRVLILAHREELVTQPIKYYDVNEGEVKALDGDLLELPNKLKALEFPMLWSHNTEEVDIWAKEQKYNLHNINWTRCYNGDLFLALRNLRIKLTCPDELGYTSWCGKSMKMQDALDTVFKMLNLDYQEERALWDLDIIRKWGNAPASYKQKSLIRKFLANKRIDDLTKSEAHYILNRLFYEGDSIKTEPMQLV